MSYLFSDTVTLLGRGPVTGHTSTNDPIYGDDTESTVSGWVEAGFGDEATDGADTVQHLYTLWLDGAVDLSPYDRVSYQGLTYTIAGDVAVQVGGTFVGGWTNARLKRVTG